MEPENKIESPYVDLDKISEERLNKATEGVLKLLGENTDLLVYTNDTEKAVVDEKQSQVAMKMFDVLIESGVYHRDLKLLTEIVQATVFMLFNSVSRVYNEYEKELIARTIGARNPLDNKLSREYATIEDMFNKLEALRKEQDKEGDSEYFTVNKKEEESK